MKTFCNCATKKKQAFKINNNKKTVREIAGLTYDEMIKGSDILSKCEETNNINKHFKNIELIMKEQVSLNLKVVLLVYYGILIGINGKRKL